MEPNGAKGLNISLNFVGTMDWFFIYQSLLSIDLEVL